MIRESIVSDVELEQLAIFSPPDVVVIQLDRIVSLLGVDTAHYESYEISAEFTTGSDG